MNDGPVRPPYHWLSACMYVLVLMLLGHTRNVNQVKWKGMKGLAYRRPFTVPGGMNL